MWFFLSLTALLFWSGSDLFSKLGSRPNDKYSHWKMVIAVGSVMGLHAAYEIFVAGVQFRFYQMLIYLPASFMYILSMLFGYIALRYIELSVSSPICNSSGAIAAVLCFIFLQQMPSTIEWIAVFLVAAGVLALSFAEIGEDDLSREMRQKAANIKYRKSLIAIILPFLYCIIDALGTFFDSLILREEDTGTIFDKIFMSTLPEDAANVAYELTFLFMAVIAAIYVFVIKKQKIEIKRETPKLIGGICETAGQLAYIYAIGDTRHVGFSAAIISAYCTVSVIWSRIFLKEKLSWKHYISIAVAGCGIILLGIFSES